MRSIVVKQGIAMEEESISLSESNVQAPAPAQIPPPRGYGRRVFNAIPSPKKSHEADSNTVIISDDAPISDNTQAKSTQTKPYVFPTLGEKEIEYADNGEGNSARQPQISSDASVDGQQGLNGLDGQYGHEGFDGQQAQQHDGYLANQDNTAFTEPFDLTAQTLAHSSAKNLYDDMVAKSIAEASRILEDAHAKARAEYNQLVENSKAELEIAKEEAYKQGVAEGALSQVANIKACVEKLEHTVARIEGRLEEYFAACEQDTKWLALEICQKVLNERVTADQLALYPLVTAAVAKQKNAPWLTVEISSDAQELLKTLKKELEKGDDGSKITINSVQAPMGTCRMQTAEGFIDASLYRQLDNLREYFMQQPE